MIRFKSAKYTIEHPLLIGALVGGAPDGSLAPLSDYGLALGEAFQLRDDLLGVFGDPEATGKPAGDDLREGKRTVLVAHALDAASDTDRDTVESLLGRDDLELAGVEAIRRVLLDTGAVDRVESLIADPGRRGPPGRRPGPGDGLLRHVGARRPRGARRGLDGPPGPDGPAAPCDPRSARPRHRAVGPQRTRQKASSCARRRISVL